MLPDEGGAWIPLIFYLLKKSSQSEKFPNFGYGTIFKEIPF